MATEKSDKKYSLCEFVDGVMTVRTSWLIFDDQVHCLCPKMCTTKILREVDEPSEEWTPFIVTEILMSSGKLPICCKLNRSWLVGILFRET